MEIIKKLIKVFLNRNKPLDNLSYEEYHHFKHKDVVKSITAKKYKIDNSVPDNLRIYHNIGHTNYRITAIIKDALKYFNKSWKDFWISSWFRCPKLNKKVGGSSTSDHMEGKVIDCGIKGVSAKELCDFINSRYYAYNQLIQEKKGKKEWTHISFDSSPYLEKNEFLIKTKDGYIKG
ncbi:hypothetical protein KAH94_03155 [bacterium]|nr:hypothetical protein [bacterium]